jgi:hypothetical protein
MKWFWQRKTREEIKKENESYWPVCFRCIQHTNFASFGSTKWEEWKQIKYSGRKVELPSQTLYETIDGIEMGWITICMSTP